MQSSKFTIPKSLGVTRETFGAVSARLHLKAQEAEASDRFFFGVWEILCFSFFFPVYLVLLTPRSVEGPEGGGAECDHATGETSMVLTFFLLLQCQRL